MNLTLSKPINNRTASTTIGQNDYFYAALTYLPLVIIGLGLICNTISFLIFRFHGEFKASSLMVYLSFVTVTDTLSLFVWNLDNFLISNFNIQVETINEPICHISSFLQYFSLESSALVLSMATIDRYFTVISIPGSFASQLPFRTNKSALFWSLAILILISLINLHVLIFPRLKKPTLIGFTCNVYTTGFKLLPTWEKVHLIIFSLIPFVLMTLFNGLLIKDALMTNSLSNSKSNQKKRRVTISLVLVTAFFILMTMPSSILFGFFFDDITDIPIGRHLLIITDCLSFLHSTSIFFITLATNSKFRNVLYKLFKKCIPCFSINYWQKKNPSSLKSSNKFYNV